MGTTGVAFVLWAALGGHLCKDEKSREKCRNFKGIFEGILPPEKMRDFALQRRGNALKICNLSEIEQLSTFFTIIAEVMREGNAIPWV